MGGHGERVPGTRWIKGEWGDHGGRPQKGIQTYAISANQQRPLAGAFHAAIFNTWRRCKGQVLYVAPPFITAYLLMDWAMERNEFLNSKPGRAMTASDE